jgi:hypothetical protein
MMTNRSHPGVDVIRWANALVERAILIGNQLADFIMASVALPRIEQAVDMTACDDRLVPLLPLRDGGVPDMAAVAESPDIAWAPHPALRLRHSAERWVVQRDANLIALLTDSLKWSMACQ